MKNLACQRIQANEIWAFCYAKAKNAPAHKKGVKGYGDVWMWVAIDADTKLVPTWVMGLRDADNAFARDARRRWFAATSTRPTSRRASSSGKTSRCGRG